MSRKALTKSQLEKAARKYRRKGEEAAFDYVYCTLVDRMGETVDTGRVADSVMADVRRIAFCSTAFDLLTNSIQRGDMMEENAALREECEQLRTERDELIASISQAKR